QETPDRKIDARTLISGYIERAITSHRYLRALPLAACFYFLAFLFVYFSGSVSPRFSVRGNWSWMFDNITLIGSIVCFIVVLFYSLDAACLAGKLLKHLGKAETNWPAELAGECAAQTGIRPEHVSGLLDVRFAVDKTSDTRVLMLLPFGLFLLLLISREHY